MNKLRITVFLVNLLVFGFLKAQTTGDYRTAAASVTWSTAGDWQTWDGSQWVTASTAPGASNNVFVQAGHTATLTGNQSCNDLYISTGTTSATTGGEGLIALQSNTLNVNGKLCCYYGNIDVTISSASGLSITSTSTVHMPIISKTSGGLLKIVGDSRNITNTNEWGATNSGSTSLFDIELALNSGQTGTFNTGIKAANWIFTSGTIDMGANRISADNGTTGQGDVTIGTNAIVLNSSTGSGSSSVISQTGTVATGRSGTLTINGILKLSGNSPYIECSSITMGINGTVEYSQSGSQNFINSTFTSAAKLLSYTNIVLSGSGTKTTLPSLATEIAANGSLSMSGGALAVGASGSFSVNSTGTTLIYASTSSQSASTTEWLTNFQNLTINNSSGVSLGFSRTINGTLTLTSGTFTNSSNLTLGNGATIIRTGGILNSAPTFGSSVNVIYNEHSSNITTGNELPSSSSVLNNLTINTSNGVTLNSAKTINGVLTFTTGLLTTTASNLLTIETSGSVSGATNSKFINGPVAKNTNSTSTFTFPIGKGSILRTIAVTPSNTNATTYTAEYFNTAYANITSFTSPITRVSSIDYFELTRSVSGTPSDAVVTLEWGSNSGVNTADVGELTLSRFAGGNWVNEAATGSGTSSSGTVVTNSAVSNFGTFSIANATTNTNLLPVKLLNFSIKENTLKWSTANEVNNDGFEILESKSGDDFYLIGYSKSKAIGGNSHQILNYSFPLAERPSCNSYYRLKQIDFNGKYEYSPIIKNTSTTNDNWIISNKLLIITCLSGKNNICEVSNLNGHILGHYFQNEGGAFDLTHLPTGLYYFSINGQKPVKFFNN